MFLGSLKEREKSRSDDDYRGECVGGGGGLARKTYPVTSDLVRPDQLAIKTEIRPLRCGA